ncbi:aquaporin-8 isoform X1 [Erinaceus europaeus]|uniref:Aquaporin-8 isoform X1 n=1 Tax=Erinaceus europaeus TaxID=9365 RepID=A0ABM3VVA9_ERIEU|nr:aquaporin-8 isoform X1 [Erinaceus europaeus]
MSALMEVPLSTLSSRPQAASAMCEPDFGSGREKEEAHLGPGGPGFERFVQPCLVELLGSALFIFIGCLSVIENQPGAGPLQPALAHGLALGLAVATLGNISVMSWRFLRH